MSKSRIRYMNGLVVVSIVFISISIVPVGVLAGVIFSEGGYNMHEITVGPNENETIHMQVTGDLMFYYDVSAYPVYQGNISIFLMTQSQYDEWIASNDTYPSNYEMTTTGDIPFRWIEADSVDYYLAVFNADDSNSIKVELHYVTANRAEVLALLSVGMFFSLWVTILALYTVGYLLKVLIFVPIFGLRYGNGDDKRRKSSYSYQYESPRPPRAPKAPAAPAAPAAKAAPAAPAIPAIPKSSAPPKPIQRGPALRSISENYTVAGQPKQYPKDDFKRFFAKTWDHASIAEKVLLIFAFFFLLTGAVTGTWYVIVVFPLVLIAIAITIYFTNRSRREKLIRIVESYQAIYVRDAARIMRTSPEFLRSDAWKIINLGLATIAFDTSNDILFDASKVDPVEAKKLSPEAEKIHAELVSEVTEKDVKEEKEEKVEEVVEVKEIECPFCESSNPPDSSFCIKCGASLKPAK